MKDNQDRQDSCERPKTNAEVLLEAFKLFIRCFFLKYLDNNKTEAIIFFCGVAGAMIIWASGGNLPENFSTIINYFK